MGGYLFVYGSLRQQAVGNSGCSDVFANHSEYLGMGIMHGRLYEVSGYPGAILSDDSGDKVWGEIYRLSNSGHLFEFLDQYEECSDTFPRPHEYVRKAVPSQLLGCICITEILAD